jgi:hypothetical protein
VRLKTYKSWPAESTTIQTSAEKHAKEILRADFIESGVPSSRPECRTGRTPSPAVTSDGNIFTEPIIMRTTLRVLKDLECLGYHFVKGGLSETVPRFPRAEGYTHV